MKNQNKSNIPLVSVVIPVYNGASYLEEAVASVLKSTYKNYEILLINDGSKDSSKELCKRLEQKYKKVHFHSFEKNRGLGRVLNFALKYAKGEYICRINQDDTMMPDRIHKQVDFMTTHPDVTLLGSWLKVIDTGTGERRINRFLETNEEIRKTWLMLSPVWDAAVMYKRKVALKVGGYDQAYWPADDLHMWYRLGKAGRIANIQEPLTTIKVHNGAASVKYHKVHVWATFKAHVFAHQNVQKAPLTTWLFWVCQLIASRVFPAQFNWFVYRILKNGFIYRPALEKKQASKQPYFEVHSKYAAA